MIRSLTVLIPAYNEELALPGTVRRVLEWLPEGPAFDVLVIDDGSTDRTRERVRELAARDPRVTCIAHERNLGLGAALRTGFVHARQEWVLYLDADHQVRIDELGTIAARDPNPDAVIGYRSWWRGSLSRTVISLGYGLAVRLLLGLNARDVNCPFKLFRRELIKSVRFESNGFLVDAEILYLLRRSGVAVEEVPVSRHARALGASTIRWRHLPELVRELVRIRMSRRAR